jgi:hypothetical protein
VASLAERGIHELVAAYNMKKQLKQETLHLEKRPIIENDSKPVVGRGFPQALGNQKPPCKTCGKLHVGECCKANPVCLKCGKTGHYQRSCPMNFDGRTRPQGNGLQQQKPTQARVYSLVFDDVDREEFAYMDINVV